MSDKRPFKADIEGFARLLAEAAGVQWSELRDYPGYGKNYWREKAKKFLTVGLIPG